MVQLFPDDRISKCTAEDYYQDARFAKQPVRQSQIKRPRASTKPSKESTEEEHFVTISRSGSGPPRIKCSASLKPYKEHIVAEALQRFVECLDGLGTDPTSPIEFRPGLTSQVPVTIQPGIACISYPFAPSAKRRRSNSTVTQRDSDAGLSGGHRGTERGSRPPERLVPLHPGDREKCKEYFRLGFQAIQQIDCRFIAKRWIKKIEPKKQVHHPYNGGRQEPRDPERTKPQWWPPGVIHREPDHINRNDRITLLTHLIMQTGSDLLISQDTGTTPMIKDLEEVTRPYTGELKNPKSWEILQDMFTARKYMELIEYEGYDAETTVVNVVDRCEATRRAQGEPQNVIADEDEIDVPGSTTPDDNGEDEASDIKAELTPTSSKLSSPALTTHARGEASYPGPLGQGHQSYEMAPPGPLIMKPDYRGQSSHPFGGMPEHHQNLQSVSQYDSPNMYTHVQPLDHDHQMYQDIDGPVSQVQSRADFVTHAMQTSQESPMGNWPATAPPEFYYPTQYLGGPSQAPSMQSTTSEQSIFDENPYQARQHLPNQPMHYTTIFDQPLPTFSEGRDSSTSRWIAFRPASNTPVPHLTSVNTPNPNETLYQHRLRDFQDFE